MLKEDCQLKLNREQGNLKFNLTAPYLGISLQPYGGPTRTSLGFTNPHLGNSLNAGGPTAGRKHTHAIAFFFA